MRSRIPGVAVMLTLCSVSLAAQWPKYQAPGVPLDAEGRVRMDAPTPRMPDGKPDLSGNWIRFRGEGAFTAPELRGLVRNQAPATQATPPSAIRTRPRLPRSGRSPRTCPAACRSRHGPRN